MMSGYSGADMLLIIYTVVMMPGYSGADMANLCREAALGPIRSLCFVDIQEIAADEVS